MDWDVLLSGTIGAVVGGIISGGLTLGGVYLTIQNEKKNRIIDSYPVKRQHAGKVIIELQEIYNIINEAYDDSKEPEESFSTTADIINALQKTIDKTNDLLNDSARVNGQFFSDTRKIITNCSQIIALEETSPFHPYHAFEIMVSQSINAKEILNGYNKLKKELANIDEALDNY